MSRAPTTSSQPSATTGTASGESARSKYGVIANSDGLPLAIEVFLGNTADPKSFSALLKAVLERFPQKSYLWSATGA